VKVKFSHPQAKYIDKNVSTFFGEPVNRANQLEGLISSIDEQMVKMSALNQQRTVNLQHTIESCDLLQQFDQLDVLVKQFKVH
jgi:hypothetical protein